MNSRPGCSHAIDPGNGVSGNPAFLAEAKVAGLGIDPTTGQELDQTLAELHATPKALIERASDVLGRTNN